MKHFWLPIAATCLGCSSSNAPMDSTLPSSNDGAAAVDALALIEGGDAATEDFAATAVDFDCTKNAEWTAVGLSHYKNALGHTAEMLAIARSVDGGTFPVGTVIQLNPAEAAVKRASGFDGTSNDWEFFTLALSDAGSASITARGGGSTVSNARGTCLGCHLPAQAAWDLVCGDDPDGGPVTAHGCAPLPAPYATLAAIVDPRCP